MRKHDPPHTHADALWSAASALAAGIAGAVVFRTRPAMRVRVGARLIEDHAPAAYQACAFPAFGALVGVLARDVVLGRRGWGPRAVLAAVCGGHAVVRLAGRSPLSGHAFFLAALAAFELASRGTPLALPLACGGLAITGAYKHRWNDLDGFARASAIGAAVGAGCALLSELKP